MSGNNKLTVVAAVALAVAAAVTLRAEVVPFLQSGQPLEHVEAAGGAPLPFGLSTYSRNLALDQCRGALTNPMARILPQEEKGRALDTCAATSLAILDRSPTNAYAASVAGYVAALRGDKEVSSSYMQRSQRLAPSQAWLATFRLRPRNEALLSIGDDDATVASDVRILGGSTGGRGWLANWYGRNPQARDFIIGEIEGLSPAEQSAFLQAVRMYMTTVPAQGAKT